MMRKVTADEACTNFGELLATVYHRGDEVIIEREGRPIAAVIPINRYDLLKDAQERARRELVELITEVQEENQDVPYEVIQKEVDEAIREVRDERRRRAARE